VFAQQSLQPKLSRRRYASVSYALQNSTAFSDAHRTQTKNKKLIRRWDSERELSLRWHRTHTTKYNTLGYKFRDRSTRLCVRTQVYQIHWNNAMQRPLRSSRSFKITDFGTNRKLIYDFLLL